MGISNPLYLYHGIANSAEPKTLVHSWQIFFNRYQWNQKQISTLKAFLNYCKRKGFPINEGFKDFVIRRQRLEVTALNHYEFEKIFNLDLSKNRRLDQIRDIFCFSCVTGFRFSDLEQLRREHIKQGEIILTIKKTKEHLIVPLNVFSNNILKKYKEGLKPLPMVSNQKFNKYLKELGQLAGIDEMVEIIRYRGNEKIS